MFDGTPAKNIALIGFMGAGKTTVGRLLSARLGLTFVDMDVEVEKRFGLPIPKVFADLGEEAFRREEATLTQALVKGEGQVIATGGGAVSNPETLDALKKASLVVWLHGPIDLLYERAKQSDDRPLLAGGAQHFAELLGRRLPAYSQADMVVSAQLSPEEAALQIATAWQGRNSRTGRVEVNLGPRSYSVYVGTGLIPKLADSLPSSSKKALVVTDSNVALTYGTHVTEVLRSAGWEVEMTWFPAGEENKTLETLRALYSRAVSFGLDRESTIVAVGGGVVGDVAGFFAATYLRGIPFVQVPTTLLAQVDSSIGGKVAVDLPEGKNLVGAFYQPKVVVADMFALTSLPNRQLLSGLAEVIKHGVIADVALFQFIEEHLEEICAKDPEALAECVLRSCRIKGGVVEEDEQEAGLREVLNLGHTLGHAVEVVTGFQRFTHGEAVALGMVAAAKLGTGYGLPEKIVHRLAALLRRSGLPWRLPEISTSELLAAMQRDKKVRHGELRFALPTSLGEVKPGIIVTPDAVRDVVRWQQHLPE